MVHIVDSLLPGLLLPEVYDDVIKVLLWDKNDDPVINSSSCSDVGLPQDAGEHCSNLLQVEVTNLMPEIVVEKSADTDLVEEPGEDVTFTVKVTNQGTVEPVKLTSLVDVPYGDLNGQGSCVTGGWIAPGAFYSCTFVQFVEGNFRDEKEDTATAIVEDNEGNTDEAFAKWTVTITNSPSDILLIKDADKANIDEPGEWVLYDFKVTNISDVDTVWIDSLTDDIYGDLTIPDPKPGSYTTCDVDPPVKLLPSEFFTCEYYVFVTGDAYPPEKAFVENTALAEGYDDDLEDVSDDNKYYLTINDVLPEASLTKEVTKVVVTYEVVVTNDSSAEVLYVDALMDDKFGDLNGKGTCAATGQAIAIGGDYTCTFVETLTAADGLPHTDKVTGTVSDNEENDVTPSPFDTATVDFY